MDTSWSSFDIGVNAKVSVSQPSASSTLIGRISGGRPSSIDGTLTANGRVVLINPNGIHFGANSRVDVGGGNRLVFKFKQLRRKRGEPAV
jgi:filamentous hemagglutinin family protein